jgi:hypothetical protein
MKAVYPLVGLSKPKSATLTGPKEDFFWATIAMPEEEIKDLWNYCSGDWEEKKYGIIEFKDLSSDGFPIDAKLIGISLTPTL